MEITRLDDLHPDIIARVLRHLDGPALAVAGCSTSLLRSLSCDPDLWRRLCLSLSSCPSLRHPLLHSLLSGYHRSFFFDSFPSPFLPVNNDKEDTPRRPLLPTRFFSAVDLHRGGSPVFSRVIDTDASSDSGFLTSSFRLHATPDKPVAARPDDLSLSWVVIDPEARRSVRLTSRRPVAVTRCQHTGETLVLFTVVLRGWAVSAVVACGSYVKEVSLTVEDADGVTVSGREGLGLLVAAMEGPRRGAKWEAGARGRYEEYLKRKSERSEKAVRREVRLELCAGLVSLLVMIFIIRLCFR